MHVLKDIQINGATKISSGKVREIFAVDGERLLMVTSDRISAFDVVLPDPIPDKGAVLNQISQFWFDKSAGIVANHVLSTDVNEYPEPFRGDVRLAGRSMLVKRARPLSVECIVRGYLAGSGWKEYRQGGTICGIVLPAGLRESERLPEPIFTPSTKAALGNHDENIPFEKACELVGGQLMERVRHLAIAIYTMAAEHALSRGLILADTKFEFGISEGELIVIDEMLTPDSSRFFALDGYAPGRPQPSFDKQFVRNYLEGLAWDKTPPGPRLPADIIAKTRAKYLEAYERITGQRLKPS